MCLPCSKPIYKYIKYTKLEFQWRPLGQLIWKENLTCHIGSIRLHEQPHASTFTHFKVYKVPRLINYCHPSLRVYFLGFRIYMQNELLIYHQVNMNLATNLSKASQRRR